MGGETEFQEAQNKTQGVIRGTKFEVPATEGEEARFNSEDIFFRETALAQVLPAEV